MNATQTFALLVHDNETHAYRGLVRANTVLELADAIRAKFPESEAVAVWIEKHGAQNVTNYLNENPDDMFFCGEGGSHRFDAQVDA